jgi:hypothetical protein
MAASFIAGRYFERGERLGFDGRWRSGKKAKASVEFFNKIAIFRGRV